MDEPKQCKHVVPRRSCDSCALRKCHCGFVANECPWHVANEPNYLLSAICGAVTLALIVVAMIWGK